MAQLSQLPGFGTFAWNASGKPLEKSVRHTRKFSEIPYACRPQLRQNTKTRRIVVPRGFSKRERKPFLLAPYLKTEFQINWLP